MSHFFFAKHKSLLEIAFLFTLTISACDSGISQGTLSIDIRFGPSSFTKKIKVLDQKTAQELLTLLSHYIYCFYQVTQKSIPI